MMRSHITRFLIGLLLVVWLVPVTGVWATGTTTEGSSPGPFTAIQMLTVRNGWVLTDTSVLKTIDGGVTWTDVTPADAGQLQRDSFYFMDALHAWVSSAKNEILKTIYYTKDGGRTWKQTVFPAEETMMAQFQFISANVGWLMAHQGMAMSHERVSFYHTVDGGQHWAKISNTDSHDSSPGRLPFVGDKFGYGFRDQNVGFVAGTEPVTGRVYLYISRDGGRTWWKRNIPIPKMYLKSQFAAWTPVFFNSKEGVIPLTAGGIGQPTMFYATRDGGQNWLAKKIVTSQDNQQFVWSFVDVKHWVATDGDKLYTTTDSGQKWKTTRMPDRMANISRLNLVTPRIGWALVNGNIEKTTNGGTTWIPITKTVLASMGK